MGAARRARRAGDDRGDRASARCAALRPGGHLVLEVADAQRGRGAGAAARRSATRTSVVTDDLAGRPRVVEGRRLGASVEEVVAALRAGLPVDPADRHGLRPVRRARPRRRSRGCTSSRARQPEQPTALLGARRRRAARAGAGAARPHRGALARRCCQGRSRSSRRTRRGGCRGWPGATRTRSGSASRTLPERADARARARPGVVAATSANLPGGPRPAPPRGRAADPRLPRFSTAATCPACRPPSSTSPATSRASCARARCPPRRRSVGFGRPSRAVAARVTGRASISAAHGRREPDARATAHRGARGHRSRDRRPARPRARAGAEPDRADRLGELHVAEHVRGDRQRPHEQVRGGLPGQALLRRLRGRRRDRAARDRPRQGALRRRPRERAAERGRGHEHGRVPRGARSRATRSSRSSSRTAVTSRTGSRSTSPAASTTSSTTASRARRTWSTTTTSCGSPRMRGRS